MTRAERTHEILYSCDSREELASRIAELEEFAQDLYEFAMSEYPDGTELNFADRMRKLGIEVPE